jgi:hypothetical protein
MDDEDDVDNNNFNGDGDADSAGDDGDSDSDLEDEEYNIRYCVANCNGDIYFIGVDGSDDRTWGGEKEDGYHGRRYYCDYFIIIVLRTAIAYECQRQKPRLSRYYASAVTVKLFMFFYILHFSSVYAFF